MCKKSYLCVLMTKNNKYLCNIGNYQINIL